ncbi:phenylalanine--tRNA ligase subunit alpha [Patescibacteria group bacterium]|nr:phenylalanine--tRNA ligase subunit alpha [Patescibacteria group bacterium]
MVHSLKALEITAKKDINKAKTLKALDGVFRVYLGKKGELTQLLKSLAKLKVTQRKKQGKAANALKEKIQKLVQNKTQELQKKEASVVEQGEWLDITMPGRKIEQGHVHPLTQVHRKAQEIFRSMGFAVAEGPEVESEWYNFDALNMPPDHPAREMWDTFWLKQKERSKNTKENFLLRTHTSPVQIRYMQQHNPPLRIIAPGRVFRYEATDARHQINFYQLEGLMVGKDVSVANFRAMIQEFYQKFFGKKITVRLRPSYFPFTEPSFEVDMTCVVCIGKGCSSCGHGGFMEMMGAGMVHPNVFKAAGYNPKNWQGFAFGMGIDRLAMMKYKVEDIRLFYTKDLRFLQQF